MPADAHALSRQLASCAHAVCAHYLSQGRKQGRYWVVGDVDNHKGHSLFVRLHGMDSGPGAAGKWTDYVALLVMLRICDWVLPRGGLAASTLHNSSALWEVV